MAGDVHPGANENGGFGALFMTVRKYQAPFSAQCLKEVFPILVFRRTADGCDGGSLPCSPTGRSAEDAVSIPFFTVDHMRKKDLRHGV